MSMSQRERLWSEFVEYTSAHGFINVRRSELKIGKAFWVLALMGCWGFGTYQVIDTIQTFLQYKTTVTVRIQHQSNAVFPAITICNLNNIKQSSMMNDNGFKDWLNQTSQKKPERHSWAAEVNETVGRGSGIEFGMQEEELSKSMVYYELYMNRVNVDELGHQISDMLLECTFQGRQCTPEDFTKWQHPTYGNCFTYVLKDPTNFPSYIGPSYGLALTLQVQNGEYLPIVCPAAGFRVQVHAPEYVPFPSEQGFTVSPGQVTSISFRQKKICRQPYPYDDTDCGESESRGPDDLFSYWRMMVDKGLVKRVNYTNQGCQKSCFQKHLLKSCGCIDASTTTWNMAEHHFGHQNSTPIACNFTDMRILECSRKAVMDQFGGNVQSKAGSSALCSNVCPQSCHQDSYECHVTSSLWPRAEYFEQLGSAWKDRNPSYNITSYEQAIRELVKIELYFQELNYEEITESASMSFLSVFSSIGGTLGLFAGMSVLTWLEFGELFIRWCRSDRDKIQDSGQTNMSK